MSRYRVHIVSRTGRFRPLLTVLVEAGTRDEAIQIAQVRCASSKVIAAEDVDRRSGRARAGVLAAPARTLLTESTRF
jgi:hypothetical protein